MTEKFLYRPAEAMLTLGIRPTKFWQLVKTGQLETHKMGGATIVTAENLKAFIANLPANKAA